MARPTKTGLDYFPFDVDFFSDPKMQFIRAKHGPRGVLAVVQLYCKIYRDGFYLLWNEDNSVLFSKYETGIPKNEVNVIINECLSREIFSKSLFEQYGILTSRGIQKRYFEASKKRKFIKGEFAYLLIKLNDYGLPDGVFSELTKDNPEKMREIGKEGNKTIESNESNESKKGEETNIPPSKLSYERIEENKLQIELESSDKWHEDICRKLEIVQKIKIDISSIKNKIPEFMLHLASQSKYPIELNDAKSYFANWIPKHLNDVKLSIRNSEKDYQTG